MRKLLFAVAVAAILLVGVFVVEVAREHPLPEEPERLVEENETAPPAPPPQATTTEPIIPQGFRGPTGQPKIIGPSGPPPNY
ncbi:hypothetical protein C4571_02565 [Candidatus Parcubacteria bacterium]|nr:MAG: hypothetical protein C4571_02565 [Candidatus Parcubacteria bacterium]